MMLFICETKYKLAPMSERHVPRKENKEIGATSYPATIRYNYCRDCDWSISAEEYSRHELNILAIKHATEYEHDIDSKYFKLD
jgi:hypothetical protein